MKITEQAALIIVGGVMKVAHQDGVWRGSTCKCKKENYDVIVFWSNSKALYDDCCDVN